MIKRLQLAAYLSVLCDGDCCDLSEGGSENFGSIALESKSQPPSLPFIDERVCAFICCHLWSAVLKSQE